MPKIQTSAALVSALILLAACSGSSPGASTSSTGSGTSTASGGSSTTSGASSSSSSEGSSSGASSTGGGPVSDAGNTLPGTCQPAPGFAGNSKGIGAYCTVDGGQCASGLDCSGAEPGGTGNFCMSIGACTIDTDCGADACCVLEEGIVHVCLPLLCSSDAGTCPS